MPKGFVYILECCDGSYYTGSTVDIEQRIYQHQNGQGANYTKKRLPVKLVYLEEFQRIDDAFYREKQIQGWSRVKKDALIEENYSKLTELSLAYRDKVSSRASDTEKARVSDTQKNTFYGHGKLLISGEYVILDGALALAIPTKLGQSLSVSSNSSNKVIWKSLDHKGAIWFKTKLDISQKLINSVQDDNAFTQRLIQVLNAAKKLNPDFLNGEKGFNITTQLEFPQDWGLGSSSTLINAIAQWANVDPYVLLEQTFGGSGYDIACAQHNSPITYQLHSPLNTEIIKSRTINTVDFNPVFKDHLYFVHLNKKQNSREGIAAYRKQKISGDTLSEISTITKALIHCKTLDHFTLLLKRHEDLIAKIINIEPVKKRLFNDFRGSIKSLGAWGGDFILVASKENPTAYFKNKGFHTILPYNDMIMHKKSTT